MGNDPGLIEKRRSPVGSIKIKSKGNELTSKRGETGLIIGA